MENNETRPSSIGTLRGWLGIVSRTLVVVLAIGGSSSGRESSPVSSDPVFVATMIDGRTPTGRIVSFEDAGVTLAAKDGKKELLPLDRLVKLARESPGTTAAGEGAQAVLLVEGDRLMRVSIVSATDASVDVRSELLGKLEVPLECVVGFVLAATGGVGSLESIKDRLLTEARSSEVVWLANGDRLDGGFLGMDDAKVRMQVDQKPVEIDRAGAVAVGFDPGLIQYPRPKRAFLQASLGDGTRLGLTSIRLNEGNVEATTRFGGAIRFPVTELARLHAVSASVVYLSDRKDAVPQYKSYIGPTRPYRLDRTVDGFPIQLGGQTYERGIGMQSGTYIAYRIAPGDRRFQAIVGVDERAGPLGSVVFRVLVNRQERFKSPPMTDRDPPKALDIDLAGGKILILVADFGDRGNVRDLADWAEARIVH